MSSTKLNLVITTCPDEASAKQISKTLVEEKLAACAQISGPIMSHYYWKEELQDDSEYRLLLKSKKALWSLLEKRILDLHPFETPQILSIDVADAHANYVDWIEKNTL